MKQHSSLWKSLKLFSIWQSSLQRLAIPKSMQICSPRFKIPYVPVADCSSDKRFNLCSSFARGVERFNFHNLNSNSCGSSDYGWMWRWCERQEKQTLFKSMRKWRVLEHKWWHFKSCLLWLWCTHIHTHTWSHFNDRTTASCLMHQPGSSMYLFSLTSDMTHNGSDKDWHIICIF